MQWSTHQVSNQVPDLHGYNLFSSDVVLMEALARENADWHQTELTRFGAQLGQPETLALAQRANQHPPELHRYDAHGNRIDTVTFDPAWHQLLMLQRQENLHALPWANPQTGAQVGAHAARTAAYFLQGQIESGSLCPITMTFASIPVLQQEPVLFTALKAKLFSREHDARDLPLPQKNSILIGMGMTEKQGGSDVRSNSTLARPITKQGRGADYLLTGHKWFFSVPMSDAHLVLAQASGGLSCFFVPRWRPDGSRNSILILRLKDKLGNRSNASSEVEFQDAYGVMVGEEGRGIQTILEMANHTRLDCVIGSAALMRNALILAIHHAQYRSAFGRPLMAQPLMRNVLVDLALESEAATMLMMRLAGAADTCHGKHENHADTQNDIMQRAWLRILTPAAKFWICKRALEFTGECMEVWGGNGYVEEAPMARMFREAPVNSIWEGSGNIMCLDVLRAVEKEAEGFELLLQTWESVANHHAPLLNLLGDLRQISEMKGADAEQQQAQARRFTQGLVLAAQACLMLQHAPASSATLFISSRLDAACGRVFGTLQLSADTEQNRIAQNAILARAWPH